MQKRLIYLVPLVIIASATLAFSAISAFKKYNEPKHVHYHAGFVVYVDGKLQDFSGARYMKEDPCTIDNKSHRMIDEQLEKAHLHDRIGNVAHMHRNNVYWSDFFTNIKYTFPLGKGIKSFVNGNEVKKIMSTKINPYDGVVIIVGEDTDTNELLEKAVTRDQIIKEEKKSESCGN